MPHYLGAVGSETSAMHCLTTAQRAGRLLRCNITLPGKTSNELPHCLGVVGSGIPIMHYLIAYGKWALQLLQCTASLPGGKR